jgi:O-antigen/teichoic acid export membrane protein
VKRDIVVTAVSQAITLLAGFALMTAVASLFGEHGVGFYSVIRRVPAAYAPIVLMGASIALSRELLKAHSQDQCRYVSLILGGLGILVFNLVLAGLAIALLDDFFYRVLIGDEAVAEMNPRQIVLLVFLWLWASSMFTYAYAFFRGRLQFVGAAAFQLLWAAVPFILMLMSQEWNIEKFLVAMGWSTFVISTLVVLWLVIRAIRTEVPTISSLRASTKYVLSFGLPRLPLFFVFSWILTGGIFLLGLMGQQEAGARYSLSYSLLRFVAVAVSSVGIVLLPRMRASSSRSNRETGRVLITFILDTAMPVLVIAIVLFPWFMLNFLHVDSSYTESNGLKMLLLLGIPGTMAYELLRNVLDAVEFRAYNTLHASVALLCGTVGFAILYWLFNISVVDAVNTATGVLFLVLGALTVWRASSLLGVDLKSNLAFPFVQTLVLLCLWFLNASFVVIMAVLLITFLVGLACFRRPWLAAVLPRQMVSTDG